MSAVELFHRAISSVGGEEELKKKLNQYSDSVCYIDRNRKDILSKYKNNWIVVYNSEVLCHAKTYDDLVGNIEKTSIPINEAVIKFISDRKVMTLF